MHSFFNTLQLKIDPTNLPQSLGPGVSPFLWCPFIYLQFLRATLTFMHVRRFSQYYTLRTLQGKFRLDTYKAPQYVGHATSRSMLRVNEDRYALGFMNLPIHTYQGTTEQPVFSCAVFDGHGGSGSAEFLRHKLGGYVENADITELATSIPGHYAEEFGGYWRNPPKLLSHPSNENDDLAQRLPLAYLEADLDLLQQDKLTGSTCTAAYIYSLDKDKQFWAPDVPTNLVVAQIGDCRAVICDCHGNNMRLTTVHHANSALEGDRLARFRDNFSSTPEGQQLFMQYINTRSFGDHQGKNFGITAEPEITQYQLNQPEHKRLPGEEAFVVIVSDGVTDKASDQEICDIVIQQARNGGNLRGTPQRAADEVIAYVQMLATRDNATSLVIRLGGWGEWLDFKDRSGPLREKKLKMALRRQ